MTLCSHRAPGLPAAALCPVALRNMICFASAGNKLSRELRGALIKLAYAGGPGLVLTSSHSRC